MTEIVAGLKVNHLMKMSGSYKTLSADGSITEERVTVSVVPFDERIAYCLGTEGIERKAVCDGARAVYGVRSDLMHGR